MISKLLCTDVLAIHSRRNLIFVGVGTTLHIFRADTFVLETKIDCLYPNNIHGIVEGPNNKLAVFGANTFCTYHICINEETLQIKEDNNKEFLNNWIITANWLTFSKCDYLVILSAHNSVYIYNTSNKHYQEQWCKEKCILYAGFIFVKNNKDLVVFSGTVFQEILIWELNPINCTNKAMSVLHRLQGHNGVIFSVIFDPVTNFICSTSDDRTIRLWSINCNSRENETDVNWKNAKIMLTRTIFGHTARVWKCIINNDTLITIGEDSLMCVWSLNGKLLNKICAHHGAAIWSIDTSDDNKYVFTGGADGAVHVWPLVNNYVQKVFVIPKNFLCSSPKRVCSLCNGNFLVFNEDGNLFVVNKLYSDPIESLYLKKYSSYCVMEVSLCRSCICFASRDGDICIYKVSIKKLELILEEKIMDCQILSIQWLQDNKIIACGSDGILKIVAFDMTASITIESTCSLPPSRERWLTAAVLYEGLLICGDRAGNMHVFKLKEYVLHKEVYIKETNDKPIQTFTKVHGKVGIQSFLILDSKLVSSGRDGMLRFYELSEHENSKLLRILHKKKMPMDWISGSIKISDDILILGFKEVEFLVYSMFYRRTIARIPCGGGHRSWDCMLSGELITFLYIRNKRVHVFEFSLNSIESPVLLNGFHTKEVYCIEPILKLNQENVLISGGEDGSLRVSTITNTLIKNNLSFRTLVIFNGHISSIKSIISVCLQSNLLCSKYLVFSVGGRAQVKVWEIDIKNCETTLKDSDISCSDVTSHMLYGIDQIRRKQSQEHNQSYIIQPETRYMDITIYRDIQNLDCIFLFIACADGFVRTFLYNLRTKYVSLKIHVKIVDRCVVKISILKFDEKVILLTMSTDGVGRFIDFTEIISKISKGMRSDNQELDDCTDMILAKFKLHQSGINSYAIKTIKKDEYLLATGGDDNLFNLIHFKISSSEDGEQVHILLLSKWNTSTAHFAQITGIKFHEEDKIFSIGLDQQINMYNYSFANDILSVKVLKTIFTFVTDVKGLTLWDTPKNGSAICAYGKGFEVLLC
nr:WD repeat-containing protein 6 isoform X1 [Megalopta genalis]XP_033338867.1 WD repeat-containing protein 6 isoform X1 [Megalopta genalis]